MTGVSSYSTRAVLPGASVALFNLSGDSNLSLFDGEDPLFNGVLSKQPLVVEGRSQSDDEYVIGRDAPAGAYYARTVGTDDGTQAPYDLFIEMVGDEDDCPPAAS